MGGDPEEAISFAEGIRAVLRGEQPEFMQTYCWHSPQEQRWFIGRATRLPGEGPIRVMVVHEPVSTGIEQHQS
jgi:hypothetical protein